MQRDEAQAKRMRPLTTRRTATNAASPTGTSCAITMSSVKSAQTGNQPTTSWIQIQARGIRGAARSIRQRAAFAATRFAAIASTPSSHVAPPSVERSWRMRKRSGVMS